MGNTENKIRLDMIANAMSYNIHLTKDFLSSKSTEEIFRFTHPSERLVFSQRIKKETRVNIPIYSYEVD